MSSGLITVRTGIDFPPVEVSLWHDRKKLQKRLLKNGCTIKPQENAYAQVIEVEIDGDTVYIVLMQADEEIPLPEQLALLAHESIHIAKSYLLGIGEDSPAEEELAYIVQSICYALFNEHIKWINGERKQ